jgi:excisionase family DNA binding protein
MNENLKLMTVEEVSELTTLKPKTIRQYCYEKTIPYIKLNGQLRFDRGDIMEWIENSKVPVRVKTVTKEHV